MPEKSSAEIKNNEASANGAEERESRIHALGSKIGDLVLEGLAKAKNVGEIVSGFYYYLTPVPQEFKITTFKTKLEPIIYQPKG